MAYTIPPGNQVGFPFASGTPYTPPDGNKVAFRFGGAPGTVFVAGFDSSAFGGGAVRNETAQVFLAGWDSGAVSGNLVLTKSLLAAGIAPGSFGQPRLANFTHEVRLGGINAFASGAAWVSLGTRRLATVGLGDTSRFGMAVMAGGVRVVDVAGRAIAPPVSGRPTLSFLVREIFPLWFVATGWGKPLVDFQHNVDISGFGGEAFGQLEVHRPRFIVDMQDLGIRGTEWGDTTLRLQKQFVAPPGWIGGGRDPSDQFGRTELYNLKQIMQQQFEVTPDDGGVFGTFNSVANRNQVPHPEGLLATRYGTAELRLAARIVTTPPFIEFTRWGDNLVAAAIRTIEPKGTDTSGWGSPLGNIIYNGSRMLAPAAVPPGEMGKPSRVWSNLQTLLQVGDDVSSFGAGMVDYAIRTLEVFSLPPQPPFGNANMSNWERYVSVPGTSAGSTGVPTVEQHFTIIAPKSVLPPANAFGDGRVRNVTPEVALFGWTATEFGKTAIHNQFEHYAFEGFGGETFGRHVVKDRRIFVSPGGVAPLPISQKHQVRNVDPDPPAAQTVSPDGISTSQVSGPVFRTNVLYPSGAGPVTIFGTAILVSNGILATGITPPYSVQTGVQFGIPSFNGSQFFSPVGIEAPSTANTPVADVGPRYVWAPMGYPYTTGFWHESGQQMDASVFGIDHPERPVFGRLTVTHKDRTLAVTGSNHLGMGTPRAEQHPLYARPTGTSFQRFGFPTLNGGGEVGLYGFDMSLFGSYAVNHAEDLGPRTIRPAGFATSTLPRQDVQNFNRTIAASGFDAFRVSPPAAPAWPRTSTWISNAYAPFPFQGSEHTAYGTTWVSNYRRYVESEGWQSEVVAMDSPGSFKDRMHVRKQGRIAEVTVDTGGGTGSPDISLWRHGIHVGGMDPPLPGRPTVQSVLRVNPDGFDGAGFGDLQRWEPGKVKPHGDDLSAFGRSILRRAIGPAGFAGNLGEPRLGAPVALQGDDHLRAGQPTMVSGWCGDRAIAIHEGPAGVAGIPTLEAVP